MKAWLLVSDGAATSTSSSLCRNKFEGYRPFGIEQTDTSNCVEFCELHVDSSGNIFYMTRNARLLLARSLNIQTPIETSCQPRCSVKTAKAVSQPLPPQPQPQPQPHQLGVQPQQQHHHHQHRRTAEGSRGFFQTLNKCSGRGRQAKMSSCL